MLPRAQRRDANEQIIVKALREAGCEVWILDASGPADLLVFVPMDTIHGYDDAGYLRLLEVKDSAKPPSARKLTPKQQETHKTWPVIVVSTVAEALQAVRGGV